MGQQRLSGHANGGPTTHLSLVYRWANGGSTEAYRWLAIVGPTAHLSLVYRWPTVGPPVASHRWANRGPPVASHRWPNGGPTEAHRWLLPPVGQQRLVGHAHSGPPVAATVGPSVHVPLAHRWPTRVMLSGSFVSSLCEHEVQPVCSDSFSYLFFPSSWCWLSFQQVMWRWQVILA